MEPSQTQWWNSEMKCIRNNKSVGKNSLIGLRSFGSHLCLGTSCFNSLLNVNMATFSARLPTVSASIKNHRQGYLMGFMETKK